MTLIVAADVQDHLILAGDHCAVLSRLSNDGPPQRILFNFRKLQAWKYGAIAASGHVPLTAHFIHLVTLYDAKRSVISLQEIARQAKASCTQQGASAEHSTGNIFLTLLGQEGFQLHMLCVEKSQITLDTIEPIGSVFSLSEDAAMAPAAYKALNGRLRPSFFFKTMQEFHHYHLECLRQIYAQQSAHDPFVTSSFDLAIFNKQTGEGWFWQTPSAAIDREWTTVAVRDALAQDSASMTNPPSAS